MVFSIAVSARGTQSRANIDVLEVDFLVFQNFVHLELRLLTAPHF